MSRGAKAVALQLGGKTFWLQYDIDKLCLLEELLDLSVDEINAQLASNGRLGFVRAVLWAGLQAHHPAFDLKAAGELLALSGAEGVGPAIGAAFAKAFPGPEAAEDQVASENPPLPTGDGTG